MWEKMWKAIKDTFTGAGEDRALERYLAEAVDHADLERRIRNVERARHDRMCRSMYV